VGKRFPNEQKGCLHTRTHTHYRFFDFDITKFFDHEKYLTMAEESISFSDEYLNALPKDAGPQRDISGEAVWSLSSCKVGKLFNIQISMFILFQRASE
jgi:hypothetical protein